MKMHKASFSVLKGLSHPVFSGLGSSAGRRGWSLSGTPPLRPRTLSGRGESSWDQDLVPEAYRQTKAGLPQAAPASALSVPREGLRAVQPGDTSPSSRARLGALPGWLCQLLFPFPGLWLVRTEASWSRAPAGRTVRCSRGRTEDRPCETDPPSRLFSAWYGGFPPSSVMPWGAVIVAFG